MKIIENGTEVLIFKYISQRGIRQNEDNYILGEVISSEKSHDLSYHGSPYHVQIYQVIGEDGMLYRGSYDTGTIGNSYFRTKEDHIKKLYQRVEQNNQNIQKLATQNNEYYEKIKEIEGYQKVKSIGTKNK